MSTTLPTWPLWFYIPAALLAALGLRNPIYGATAKHGHFGREPGTITYGKKKFNTFTWEKTDKVAALKAACK